MPIIRVSMAKEGGEMVARLIAARVDAATCDIWTCWLDKHEGTGVWVGSAATFLAAVVALSVAVAGALRDARVRALERARQKDGVVESIRYALNVLIEMRNTNAAKITAGTRSSVPASSVLAMFESALTAVRHALSLPFADQFLLRTALNLMSSLTLLYSGVVRQREGGAENVTAVRLASLFEPLNDDINLAWEQLERLEPSDRR